MSQRRVFLSLALFLAFSASALAQSWRNGTGRLEGVVTNEKGEPIEGAVVALRWNDGKGPDLKTDKKGKWAILGISGGGWNIDVTAPGYEPKKLSANVSEITRALPMKIQLFAEVKQEAAHEVIKVDGKEISKETATAIEKGNAAMAAKNYAEAIEDYGKVLQQLPDNMSILVNLEIACYFGQKYDDALKFARQIVEKDPTNTTSWLMVAELELQKGNMAAGKEALSKVPDDKISDPQPYMNMGILYYNKNMPVEADEYFTKAINKKPDGSEPYYYRGLARYQAASSMKDKQAAAAKIAESKADFQKYLEIDPAGKDAETVKELLKSLSETPRTKKRGS